MTKNNKAVVSAIERSVSFCNSVIPCDVKLPGLGVSYIGVVTLPTEKACESNEFASKITTLFRNGCPVMRIKWSEGGRIIDVIDILRGVKDMSQTDKAIATFLLNSIAEIGK